MLKNLSIIILFSTNLIFCQNQAKIKYQFINYTKEFNSKTSKKKNPSYNALKIIEQFPFALILNNKISVFKIENTMSVGNNSNRSDLYKKMLPDTYIDLKNMIRYDLTEFSGKTFLVKEKVILNWVITDEEKYVKGYLCKKANLLNENNGTMTQAWFTLEIPLNIGPSYYFGLPGLVLETKTFNKNGNAYSGFIVYDIDLSNQKKVIIPNISTITEKEFIDILGVSRNSLNKN